ncbi:cytochrome C oxidase assembly protein, partial [Salmonella enterica subsp. enterica serovar Typhimurium]
LVMAAPVTLRRRAWPKRSDGTRGPREVLLSVVHSRYLNVVANPAVSSALFFVSLIVFYYTPFFELALRTHTGHILMNIHFLVSGYLFAWAL